MSPQISLSSIVAMEIKKSSLAGEFVWLWTGSEIEDTPTSRFLFHLGGKSHQGLIHLSEVCRSLLCGSVSQDGGRLRITGLGSFSSPERAMRALTGHLLTALPQSRKGTKTC